MRTDIMLTTQISTNKNKSEYEWRFYIDTQNPDLGDVDLFVGEEKIIASSATKDNLIYVGDQKSCCFEGELVTCAKISERIFRHECLSKNYPEHITIKPAVDTTNLQNQLDSALVKTSDLENKGQL
jgi:hypothetical protein